jgi:hypothetical protein
MVEESKQAAEKPPLVLIAMIGQDASSAARHLMAFGHLP